MIAKTRINLSGWRERTQTSNAKDGGVGGDPLRSEVGVALENTLSEVTAKVRSLASD